MLTKVRAWIERQQLIGPAETIVAACSGGPDSLALVHILSRLAPQWGLTLAVAHVDHMFRGAESEADAAFVGEFCAGLGLAFHQIALDVPAYIGSSGRSPQDAARVLRYRYLRQIAAKLGGAKIATGHHRDDQAETVLLNLLRGAGSTGLAGMKPVDGDIIRPLLDITRDEIEAYCIENDLRPRLDSSNLKTHYLRNYLRLELMPLLQQRFNANLTQTLCRTARLVGDEHQFIAEQASCLSPDVIRQEDAYLELDCRRLNSCHIALRREIFRQAIAKKRGSLKGITFLHVERLVELASNGIVGSVIELPGGLVARKGYDLVTIELPIVLAPLPRLEPPGIELNVPGVTTVPILDLTLTARLLTTRPDDSLSSGAIFDWDQLIPPLTVRTRQEGDRFWPSGAPGSKKLKDFLIDGKVLREERDHIPIVCDQQGIIWVGGYRQTERARPDNSTRCFLHLTLCQED
jgi:tRNA(Ile)-lysidine synthase